MGWMTINVGQSISPNDVANLLQSISAAADYDASATYDLGDYCTYQGRLYKANQDIAVAEDWTAAHWTETSIMGEILALDYDPSGTAAAAVQAHNQDAGAHPAIQAAMMGASVQVSYNQGGAA